jgi:DUF1365 family protein
MFYFHVPENLLGAKSGNFLFGINKGAIFSLHAQDHGEKDTPIRKWIEKIIDNANLNKVDKNNISLITLPRVLGFVFNPVSFWMCRDSEENLRAVICEVNNTFGQKHTYVCFKDDQEIIQGNDNIVANKVFHVSPFLEREGFYKFRFSFNHKKFISMIDYYNDNNDKMLSTSVVGDFTAMDHWKLIRALFLYPLITLKVVVLIHWQALKIFLKGISYVPKPEQKDITVTHSLSTKFFTNNKE